MLAVDGLDCIAPQRVVDVLWPWTRHGSSRSGNGFSNILRSAIGICGLYCVARRPIA